MKLSSSLRDLFRRKSEPSARHGESDEQLLELLRLALRGANAGAWVFDAKSGRTHWNEQLDELYGFDPSLPQSFQRWVDRLHSEDREWAVADQFARLDSDEIEYEREFRIIHPDQGVRWIMNKGSIERDANGVAQRLYGIDIDITERKEAQRALQEADRRKDEFLAILAHELRNPLAPLRNSLEILRVGRDDSALMEKAINNMDQQLEHIVLLVNDLLDNSRLRHGKLLLRKHPTRIADVIAQAVEVSEGFVSERQNQLVVGSLPGDIYIDGDLMRLVQVIANLLNNAAKFTGPGGCIWLDVREEGGEVIISVRDNGIGISGDRLPQLFRMFSQAAPPLERGYGGLGVGLSLVRGLVELHGGEVEAHSEGLGQGAEFLVRLPTTAPPTEDTLEEQAVRPEFAHDLRILVVDDNRDSAISMATLLDLTGNQARCVFDGETALQVAEEFRPHVVFLDIGMPVLNGYEVARRIRQQQWGQDMVIVANSGWGQEQDRQRSTEAGFDYHLVKPVEFSALQAVLKDKFLG